MCARNSQTGFNRLSLWWQAIVGVTQIRLRRSYMRDWGMSLILFTDFQLEENEIKSVFVFVSLAYVMMVIGGASTIERICLIIDSASFICCKNTTIQNLDIFLSDQIYDYIDGGNSSSEFAAADDLSLLFCISHYLTPSLFPLAAYYNE